MSAEFTGRWVLRGSIRVPVIEAEPERKLCGVCGTVSPVGLCRPCRDSSRVRVHGSHPGFNQHKRRNEKPCPACATAERLFQRSAKRTQRHGLSAVDRAWCERAAVVGSWLLDTRTNRASVSNTTIS